MAAEEDNDGTLALSDLLAVVWRRIWLILAVTAACTGLAIALALSIPNRYDAIAFVQVDPREKKISGIEGVIQDLKGDTPTIESEVELILSSRILLKAMADLDMHNDAELIEPAGLLISIRKLFGWKPPAMPRFETPAPEATPKDLEALTGARSDAAIPERNPVLAAFAARVKTKRLRNTLLIAVQYSSRDPVKASRVANAIAEAYIASQIETKTNASTIGNTLLEQKLETLKGSLAEAERKLERFKAENNTFDTDGGLLIERQLAREMETLVAARQRTTDAASKYQQSRRMVLNGEGAEAVTGVIQSHSIRQLRDEVTKAARRQAVLQTKYGPLHPEMGRAAADLAKAESALLAETNNIILNLKAEYDIAREHQARLERRLETLKADVVAARSTEWEHRALVGEVKTSRQLYEALLARRKQMTEMVGLQFPDGRVVERAGVPLAPAAPKRMQLAIFGLVAGLVIALGVAFLVEFMAPGFARNEDIERVLDVDCIASLPLLASEPKNPGDALTRLRMMMVAPNTAFTDAVRELRHAIDQTFETGGCKTIMLASALPGEGKSLIAANLALHYALCGSRALLIDADMRRGSLTRDQGLTGQGGLMEVLSGQMDVDHALMIDQSSGLTVLPAAAHPDYATAASELLAGPNLASVLARLSRQFDVIVIDTPPVLPVVDARVLANFADGIVMVMTWQKTPKDLARKAMKVLGRNVEKLLGVVVNKVAPTSLPVADAYQSHRLKTVEHLPRAA